MRTATTTGLTLALLTVSLAAQQGTTPKGNLTAEGNGVSEALGVYNNQHVYWTMVDATNAGQAHQIKAILLRRDGERASSSTYVPRAVTLSVRLAHANFGKVVNGDMNPDAVWRTTNWFTVLDKLVVLPGLTTKPATAPAPFTISLPFTTPWTYNGVDALAMQVRTTANNLAQVMTPYPLDAISTTNYAPGIGQPVGVGCSPTGQTQPMGHSSLLDNFGNPGIGRWQLTVTQGPVNAPSLALLGASNPDLAFGGCAKFYVLPQIVLPAGTTNASGYVNLSLVFPSNPAYVGVQLYSQMAALDAAQPVLPFALSHGRKATFPANPILPAFAGGIGTSSAAGWPTSYRLNKGSSLVVGLTW